VNLETILGHIGALILIAIPFLLLLALAIKEMRHRNARKAGIAAINQELKSLQEQITLVTTPDVPGRSIATELGPVTVEGSAGTGFIGIAGKKALIVLMRKARAMGADGIVNYRHESGAVEAGKTKRQPGIAMLIGTAVKLTESRVNDPSL
jgi:uncharacterized protein YbjQ (UPF0145 family)